MQQDRLVSVAGDEIQPVAHTDADVGPPQNRRAALPGPGLRPVPPLALADLVSKAAASPPVPGFAAPDFPRDQASKPPVGRHPTIGLPHVWD